MYVQLTTMPIFHLTMILMINPCYRPERPNPLAKFYLGPRQVEIALERARRTGRKAQVGITPKGFLRCFTLWQLWAFALAWPLAGNTTPSRLLQPVARVPGGPGRRQHLPRRHAQLHPPS